MRHRLRLAVGLALLLMGIALQVAVRGKDITDVPYLHGVARMAVRGLNAYDMDAYRQAFAPGEPSTQLPYQPYPPSTGLALAPLAPLSNAAATWVWFGLLLVGLLAGLWTLQRTVAPTLHLATVSVLLGAVMLSACVRWGFTSLQSAPLVAGILALFIASLYRGRTWVAAVCAAFVLCMKLTNSLPFIGLLLLQRRFAAAAAALGVFIAVMAFGFARMGGSAVVADYRRNVAMTEGLYLTVNYPDPHVPGALIRLDWPFLLNAVRPDVPLNNRIGAALTVLASGWLAWQAWRVRSRAASPDTLVAFAPSLCCLTLLWTYHHHYEASMLLPALLALNYGAPSALRAARAARWFTWLTVPYIWLWALQLEALATRLGGPAAQVWAKALGACVVVAALLAGIALVNTHVARVRDTQAVA